MQGLRDCSSQESLFSPDTGLEESGLSTESLIFLST